MDIITILLIAFSLSMDAFSVSLSNGLCYSDQKFSSHVLTAFTFGLFQALMPVIGFFAGIAFVDFISGVDHYLALILLGIIGGKMIWEAYKEMKSIEEVEKKPFSNQMRMVQAIATSIDALAVGISFAAMKVDIITCALIIGVTTFGLCVIAAIIGKKCSGFFKEYAQILGGVILIGIGIKIFVEHVFM